MLLPFKCIFFPPLITIRLFLLLFHFLSHTDDDTQCTQPKRGRSEKKKKFRPGRIKKGDSQSQQGFSSQPDQDQQAKLLFFQQAFIRLALAIRQTIYI